METEEPFVVIGENASTVTLAYPVPFSGKKGKKNKRKRKKKAILPENSLPSDPTSDDAPT